MAVELALQLTQASDARKFTLNEDEIMIVYTDTLGSNVVYFREGKRRAIVVTEIPAKVAGLTKSLIFITDSDSVDQYINANHIVLIDGRNDGVAGSIIKYDMEGAYAKFITVSQTKGAINKTIQVAAGNTAYTILSTDVTNSTFTLATADGDVTAIFATAKFFTVVDSDGNDGSYEVASSTFGSSTVITCKEVIPDGGDTGSILIVTTG